MPDDTDTEKPRLTYPVGLSLTDAEGATLSTLAAEMDRPVAYVARILVREALAARAAAPTSRR